MDDKTLNDEEITVDEFTTIPKDLRLLILNIAIGTRPFEVDELDEFVKLYVENAGNMIGLFCTVSEIHNKEYINRAVIHTYEFNSEILDTFPDVILEDMHVIDSYGINYSHNEIKYLYTDSTMGSMEPDKLIEILDGRFDAEIVIPTDEIAIGPEGIFCTDDPIIDIVFLDLKSMHYILKMRFSQFVPDRCSERNSPAFPDRECGELAKRYTTQFLNSLVDKYQGIETSFLITYMLMNLDILNEKDLYDQISKIICGKGDRSRVLHSTFEINPECLQFFRELCDTTYIALTKLINNFE